MHVPNIIAQDEEFIGDVFLRNNRLIKKALKLNNNIELMNTFLNSSANDNDFINNNDFKSMEIEYIGSYSNNNAE